MQQYCVDGITWLGNIAHVWVKVSGGCNKHINLLLLYFQLGEGPKKCIRYWPDDEISHEHIHVKYIQSESCPYYTRRELNVVNTKVSLIIDVGHAQITTHILP